MSFIAQLILDSSESLLKFKLVGTILPATPKEKISAWGLSSCS